MPINQLNPYLYFNGNARKAIQLYEQALGAKCSDLMPYSAAPDMKIADKDKDLVMHAMLQLDGGTIMISDSMPGEPVAEGANVQVLLDFDEIPDMTAKFNALAKTGTVTMPLADAFWGAHFGSLVDAFGITWMFHCMLKKD